MLYFIFFFKLMNDFRTQLRLVYPENDIADQDQKQKNAEKTDRGKNGKQRNVVTLAKFNPKNRIFSCLLQKHRVISVHDMT